MEGSKTKKAIIYLRVSTVRQASSGGEVEGYSIPAQRAACRKKAEELGATVIDEYVDAGASARSIDRPALQELLERLRTQKDVDYVIVHKVDRLARDRADDVAIGLTIHKAGAVLVSASEQIDYALVCEKIVEIVEKESFAMIERLAHTIAMALVEMGADRVWVKVAKPGVALIHGAELVSIEVERSSSS